MAVGEIEIREDGFDETPPEPVLLAEVEDAAPWERLDDEPRADYARFSRYLALGPRRKLEVFLKAEVEAAAAGDRGAIVAGTLQATLRGLSRAWRWQARAAAFDEYQAESERAAYEAERQLVRKQRRDTLRATLYMLIDQIEKIRQAGGFTGDQAEVTKMLRVVMQELRLEYEDRPEDRLEERAGSGGRLYAVDVQRLIITARQQAGR